MDIQFNEVVHRYMPGTPFEKLALDGISLKIPSGSFTAIIGHTGSGKSTFIQHLNGLLKPSSGTVQIGSFTLTAGKNKFNLKELRKKVGLVFQYPEHQLFEETVAKDICFGPINFGLSEERALNRARKLLPQVGLSEDLLEVSPFQLSGGQMRRVAIAGVLASRPEILVLDEPTAGLDPEGRKQIMELFTNYHREHETTTILVTHQMEDAARFADHIIVLNEGKVEMEGSREQVFQHTTRLTEIGLDLPDTVRFLNEFKNRFQLKEVPLIFDMKELAAYMAAHVQKGRGL
ncbi:energy-coupling factor ABC transporter ATP-binding protein [Halalkalibacter urbisdiaboli]|uniref:energy-coupling factor ABC transporter ATP-binding protein n=1 Tax=Halalkalibacter urbisdiaboli TaxID=1960589 RepID=UPI000B43D962|nr:energy-coupling factor ABC transporter ATP-binding protein [Halalkalibacter urbisdiaboli]